MVMKQSLFTAGNKQAIFPVADFKCSGLICYDLRFPEMARNIGTAYDCLIYVANWPTKRIEQWKKLLVARAIENQCYVVGLNRIGIDGNGWEYNGQSMVVDFNGDVIAELGSEEKLSVVELDKDALEEYRNEATFFEGYQVMKYEKMKYEEQEKEVEGEEIEVENK